MPPINMEIEPTKLEITAAGIYAGGTAILYTETIYALLSPLISSLIASLAPDMSEKDRKTISTLVSYGILLPFFVILSKTQYSSNRRVIVEYNRQRISTSNSLDADTKQKRAGIVPTVSAVYKSTATGISAWSMFSKIPVIGNLVGGVAALITFGGSFFTQRKFLGLQSKSEPASTNDDIEAIVGSGNVERINDGDYGTSETTDFLSRKPS